MSTGGYDLHTHSRCSDGLLRPGELVRRARLRVAGLAITDHDSVAGVEEALAAGTATCMPVVPGVELTTDLGRHEVHILGYFIDHRHPALRSKLSRVCRGRLTRAKRIVANLVEMGIPLPWMEVCRQAPGVFMGRPHIMRALIAAGLVRRGAEDAFFQEYLASGGRAFVPHEELGTEEAILLTLMTGGVPVLAHPGRIGEDAILPGLVALGLRGIEIHYPTHGPAEVERYLAFARAYGLVVTGGSDFHGHSGGPRLGDGVTSPTGVRTLARYATGYAGWAFLSTLDMHIPGPSGKG